MSKFMIDVKNGSNPFEGSQGDYLNLALNISAYCDGDMIAKMPCTQDEWDMVVNFEIENSIDPNKSLTQWMEVSL